MRSKLPYMLSIMALSVMSTFLAREVQARELRIGLTSAPGQIWVVASERLAERLSEETSGELTMSVYPSSQLGRDTEMLQQLEIGVLDLYLGALRALTSRDPAMNAWFTPYLIPDAEFATRIADTPVAKEMLSRMERFGMLGLAYAFGGYRHVLMRDTPFSSPADLRGKKIRISNFTAARTWYQALGAAPTPVPLGEAYHALQTGVLDGMDIDLDALVNLELQRIADHLTFTKHMIYPGVFLVSLATWESLQPEHRDVLSNLIVEAAHWANAAQIEADARSLEELRSAIDVRVLESPEVVFADAIAAWSERHGDEPLVREFQEEVQRQLALR